MPPSPPPAPSAATQRDAWFAWLPAISTAVMLLGGALAVGHRDAELRDDTRRIGILEAKSDGRDDKLNTIDVRTARIESKIEVLLPSDQRDRRQ